ncbi:SDR family NAD(P)-dependent oxidoreductase [Dactylosporangium sp. NPDC050688]|uniref:SDR family NAD(P)-dependent oxidoreductase n=1 Tax=Dactylosporangium sp. NPDC050688 TaxID=3157217 RepID=UPI00340BAA0B
MPAGSSGRVTVVSGGTNGMGRALALARFDRGDEVVVIGSDPAKGRTLPAGVTFLQADLTSIAATRRVVAEIVARWPVVDALALFANRQAPRRVSTVDGLEATFALYYLSRHLLSHGLRDALDRAPAPVIVNVAGVGITKGRIHWDDLQLRRRYRMITAQLQAARANDLLGVDFAARSGARARYVLYHPGFTRSGDLGPVPAPLRAAIRVAAKVAARPVEASVRPVVDWVDAPPAAPLTAVDRGRSLPLDLPTLDPMAAARLAAATAGLLRDTVPGAGARP